MKRQLKVAVEESSSMALNYGSFSDCGDSYKEASIIARNNLENHNLYETIARKNSRLPRAYLRKILDIHNDNADWINEVKSRVSYLYYNRHNLR